MTPRPLKRVRRQQTTPSTTTQSACSVCPSMSPCTSCTKTQICQQVFRPSGECSTCPVNVCLARPSDDSSGSQSSSSSSNAALIGGPVGGSLGVLAIACVVFLMVMRRRRAKRAVWARGREEDKRRVARGDTLRLGGGGGGGGGHAGEALHAQTQSETQEHPLVDLNRDHDNDEQEQTLSPPDDPFADPLPPPRFSTACASHLSRITEDEEEEHIILPLAPTTVHRAVGAPVHHGGILLNGIRPPSRPVRDATLDLRLSEAAAATAAGTSTPHQRRNSTDTMRTTSSGHTTHTTRTTRTTASAYMRAQPRIMTAIRGGTPLRNPFDDEYESPHVLLPAPSKEMYPFSAAAPPTARMSISTTTTSQSGFSIPILRGATTAIVTPAPLESPSDVGENDSASVRTRWDGGEQTAGYLNARRPTHVASTITSIDGLSVLDGFSWSASQGSSDSVGEERSIEPGEPRLSTASEWVREM